MAHPNKSVEKPLARIFVLALLAATRCTSLGAQGWQHLGAVRHVEQLPDGVELTAGSAKVRITAFRDGVVRVRLAPKGDFP